jgi:peptidoglycan DL-endopeptidase CwlO
VRDKARSLAALAGVAGLLGTGLGLGVPAVRRATSSHPASQRAAAARAASAARSLVPLLGTSRLASFSLPVAPVPAPSTGTVAPLHGLLQADMIVVASSSLPPSTLSAIQRLPGVTGAQSVEAAKVQVDGKYTAMLGVDPSAFRGYAAEQTAASDPLWRSVAGGAVAVSYTMGRLDKLPLGGMVHVNGARRESLPVGGFGTVGIEGVDAVVSHSVARSLGMPAANAIVISAPRANLASLATAVRRVIPHGASAEPLMEQVSAGATTTEATAAGVSGISSSSAAAGQSQIVTMLNAAVSRQGMPYVWGAAGPSSFDCSGLVQWSFAQAGVRMPRVAADQARTGPAVPVGQLQPGDLLFYHTDPTDPGYISHVAIYLGGGKMIQAPQPGQNVEVVPADTGSEFAGAVRVDPALAAAVAGSI